MRNHGIFYLILYSCLTGMSGFFIKNISGLRPEQILFFRAVLASVFLLGVAVITRKISELKIRFPAATFFMGITQGLSIYFYYQALTKTTITNTMLLVYTAPVFSVILAVVFLKEKIYTNTILGVLASLIGVLIVSDPARLQISQDHLLGSFYALLGGFFYSAMAISSKIVVEKATPLYAAFWQYFIIMISFAIFSFPVSPHIAVHNLPILLYLGWISGGLAFLIYMKGIKLVAGQIIQVVTMLEIVIGSLSGIILLREPVTAMTVVGGAFIITGILIVSVKKNKI